MFTGIIEETGVVRQIDRDGQNLNLVIESGMAHELKVDQSIAHNGICLTVTEAGDGWHRTTAVRETIERSNIGSLQPGDLVNLERCLRLSDRLDGHIVQGHVDTTAICTGVENENGSWLFTFEYPEVHDRLIVQKGSVAVNGVSLTVIDPGTGFFKVAIIPYTYEHTNFKHLGIGNTANIEFDLIGKYILKNWKSAPVIDRAES